MGLAKADKVFNTFVRGLITEAGPLTFPENASYDEDNTVLDIKGNRKRRKGIGYEDDWYLSTETIPESTLTGSDIAISTYTWTVNAESSDFDVVVIQMGDTLYFYKADVEPLSDGQYVFTVDLTAFQSTSNVGNSRVSFSSGKGALFCTSPRLNPFYILLDENIEQPPYSGSPPAPATQYTATACDLRIRDFEGVDDGLELTEMPLSLGIEHEYNLYNQGWTHPNTTIAADTYINQFKTDTGYYPSNVQQWFPGKDDTNELLLDSTNITTTGWGTTRSPRGHFILDPFNKNRSAASGIGGLPTITTTKRPTVTAFHAGRVWFGGENGKIYFSQVIVDDFSNVGFCYQSADPTAEESNALVDTDGGVVLIPEAEDFVGMAVLGDSLIAISTNGVWTISGGESGFKATDFRISEVPGGTGLSAQTVVDVEGVPVWFGEDGIYSVSADPVSGRISIEDLTITTIRSYYLDIPIQNRSEAAVVYDEPAREVIWMYKSADNSSLHTYFYDKAIVFNVSLGSFVPRTIADLNKEQPYVAGGFSTGGTIVVQTQEDVTDGGVTVTDGGVDVTVQVVSSSAGTTQVKYLTMVPNLPNYQWTFSLFNNSYYKDWQEFDGLGAYFRSYLHTGYDLGGDPALQKFTPYVSAWMNKVEQGFMLDDDDNIVFRNPGGLIMRATWDWTSSADTNKWSRPQQIYRFRRPYVVDENTLEFDDGYPVVATKNRVRGHGQCVQLLFESEDGKDFDLVGWRIDYNQTTNT